MAVQARSRRPRRTNAYRSGEYARRSRELERGNHQFEVENARRSARLYASSSSRTFEKTIGLLPSSTRAPSPTTRTIDLCGAYNQRDRAGTRDAPRARVGCSAPCRRRLGTMEQPLRPITQRQRRNALRVAKRCRGPRAPQQRTVRGSRRAANLREVTRRRDISLLAEHHVSTLTRERPSALGSSARALSRVASRTRRNCAATGLHVGHQQGSRAREGRVVLAPRLYCSGPATRGIVQAQAIVHADRGTEMTAQPVCL